jgi:hypothetical protein
MIGIAPAAYVRLPFDQVMMMKPNAHKAKNRQHFRRVL